MPTLIVFKKEDIEKRISIYRKKRQRYPVTNDRYAIYDLIIHELENVILLSSSAENIWNASRQAKYDDVHNELDIEFAEYYDYLNSIAP